MTANKSLSPTAKSAQYKTIAADQQKQIKGVMSASQQAKYKSAMAGKKSTKMASTKMAPTKMAAKPAPKSNPMMASKMAPTTKK